ncbi:MAG: hypothetical protein A4E73_03266 [Syntrophaceae bacterium PtaU1.Bin231]|nr:MAG: hypothetical protein A4E73_03266 [Syntrophaceae bacterium PtaU1.Bin231]
MLDILQETVPRPREMPQRYNKSPLLYSRLFEKRHLPSTRPVDARPRPPCFSGLAIGERNHV